MWLISTKFMSHLDNILKLREGLYLWQMWGSAVHYNESSQWDLNLHTLSYYRASPKALLA